ncbi:hypothetical protein NECAME_08875 [Necator americanus]|uniref:DUF5641 domain-containing protein n=1 Tax=Necator americanus TaxID=51031 RepID=W2TIB2_NECAM|nr:hypothetical protein NECAME_08875 [Necator americanus]ETN80911.1 hypothetical protein NECAME_08875 [Necator americanus]
MTTEDIGDELPSFAYEQLNEMLTVSKKSSSEDDLDLIKSGQVRTWTKAKRVLAYTLRFPLVVAAKLNITRINKIMLFDNVQYALDSIPLSGPEQRDIQLSYPLGFTSESEYPHYLPPIEAAAINTKRQAIAALEASCKLTDKFWNTSQAQYLTALREKHTREVSHEKGCSRTPELGTLVLIYNSLQPLHSWKHGVIHQVIANNEGKIREVVVRLPSQRLIKHLANLLVPLELDDNGSSTKEISKKPK